MYDNIVLSGGNTMFQGFPERLQQEIENASPEGTVVNIEANEGRKNSVWTGA